MNDSNNYYDPIGDCKGHELFDYLISFLNQNSD